MPSNHQYILNEQPTYTTLQNATYSQHTEYFDSICGLNAIIPHEINMEENRLYLKIIEQPSDTFRYRYKSEKGSHGGIKGENNSRTKKSFPTVKLENCPPNSRENIIIRVSLYRNEPGEKLHVYELTGKNSSNGKCESTLNEHFMAVFSTIAISTRKKEEVYEILKQRKISDYDSAAITYDEATVEMEVQEEMKNINLDSAKLCFEAFSTDDMNTPLCEKVFSNPINNQKSAASGDLKIVRLSRCSGKCSGGDEIFLLCEKVKKEDIKVRFFENHEEGVWEDYGDFNPAEVHHQVVIILKTPKYYQTNIRKKVYIELVRPSDGKCSEPRPFDYIPDDHGILDPLNRKRPDIPATSLIKKEFSEISRKRKRPNLEKDIEDSESNLNFSSVMDSPQSIDDESMNFDKIRLPTFEELPLEMGDFWDTGIPSDVIDFNIFSEWLSSEDKQNESVEEQLEDLPACDMNDILIQRPNFVVSDSMMNQISFSINSLSLADQTCEQELETRKVQKASKDFIDGMSTILQNREANTYLHYAPHLIPLEDENRNNMLHLAILEQNGNWNLIRNMLKIITEDAINHQNKFKETPLHLAIKGNHVEILLLLLIRGADPNLLDEEGNNCLHMAAKYGHINCLTKLILPADCRRTWKHKINDIDAVNYDGMSALHIAVTRNFEDCVTFLLNFKVDVNLPERKCGRTSLHLAIEQPSLLKTILRQPETDICAKDFKGYTAVHLACLKAGKSFEDTSTELEDDKNKIIKFLENFNQNSEAKSNGDSTDSSDFEDAVEELSSFTCNEVVYKTISTTELMYMNEKNSNLMKTEEKLHKYLDVNDNWKKLADLIDLNVQYVAMFDKEFSPGQTVLKKIKDLYHPCDSKTIIEILKLAGLDEGVHILQNTS